jgi:peptidoglycan/LPS O-acetylase OafA/YrhL
MNDFKRIQAIDGLRGFSILLVILCHLDVPYFHGGFVGVDVFFVISGFVITGSLYNHLADSNLVTSFYERRLRRLLPSLLATLLICFFAFSLRDEKGDLHNLAEATGWATLGLSNFLFSHTAGYFDDSSLENPLLHTWSLGVEEQFYVLFATFLVVARLICRRDGDRMKTLLLWSMALTTFLSLALSVHLSKSGGRLSYFLLPTRFWEIGAGSLLLLLTKRVSVPIYASLGAFGLIFIIAASIVFDSSTPYPSYRALMPAIGAILIIMGSRDQHSVANKILSSQPLLYLGGISYALYLMHWPVIVFAQDYFVRDMSALEKTATALVSVVLATGMTFLWELPIQKRELLASRRSLFTFSAIGSAVVIALAVSAYSINKPSNSADEKLQHYALLSDADRANIVPSKDADSVGYVATSRIPVLGSNPDAITAVWGDSHCLDLIDNLASRTQRFDLSYKFYGTWFAMPVLGLAETQDLEHHQEEICDLLSKDPKIKNVLLAANWTGYLEGLRYFGHREGSEPQFSFNYVPVNRENAYPLFESQLRQTLIKLTSAGKHVFIATPVPTYPYSLSDYMAANGRVLAIFDRLSAQIPHTSIIPIHLDFFKDGQSLVEENGVSLYFDGHHLSTQGSQKIGDRISAAIVDHEK